MFKVLSIDGGGIRGIFAARFLQRCEECWGKKLHEIFDLVVGTSTGGIIALAAAYAKQMSNIVKLYADNASKIFHQPAPLSPRKLLLFQSKYDNTNLIMLLKREFGPEVHFDVPSCHVRIYSFDLETGESKIFRTGGAYNNGVDKDFRVWEVAAATSAAPIYFPSFSMKPGLFVDGGVWANNPSLCAVTEALILQQRLEDIGLLSVGTGDTSFRDSKKRSGILSWKLDLVDLVFQSQTDGVQQLAKKLEQKRHLNCYKRVSKALKPDESALDAIDTVEILCKFADRQFDDEQRQLEELFFS